MIVVVCQAEGLTSNALEDVTKERINDVHGLGRNTSIGMDLLQHLIDVDEITLFVASLMLPPLLFLLLLLGFLYSFLEVLHEDGDGSALRNPTLASLVS